ncbi:hypothetical protein BDZ45DRAFT_745592 [Acephala macrosclerotiorum]|nr:hypothetical protein BDZ45DRAFT_745592 [Acephala macrosclerotiorum]
MAFQLDSPEAMAMMAAITGIVTKALREVLSNSDRAKQQKAALPVLPVLRAKRKKSSRHEELAPAAETKSKKFESVAEERLVRSMKSKKEIKASNGTIKTRHQRKKESKTHKKIRKNAIIESSSDEEEVEEEVEEDLEIVEETGADVDEADEGSFEEDLEGGSAEELEEINEEIEDSESDFAPASPHESVPKRSDKEPQKIKQKLVSYESSQEEVSEPISETEADVEEEEEEESATDSLRGKQDSDEEEDSESVAEAEIGVEEKAEEPSATESPPEIPDSDNEEDVNSGGASEMEIDEQMPEPPGTQLMTLDTEDEEADSGYASEMDVDEQAPEATDIQQIIEDSEVGEVDEFVYNSDIKIHEHTPQPEETQSIKEELNDDEDIASAPTAKLKQDDGVRTKTEAQPTVEDSDDEELADSVPTRRSRKQKRTLRPTWKLRPTKTRLIVPTSSEEEEESSDESEVEPFQVGGIPDPRETWPVVEIPPKSQELMQSIERDFIPYKPRSHKRREYSEESEEHPTPPTRMTTDDSAADSDPDYSLPVPRRGPDGKFLASNARFNYAQYIQQKAAKEKERKQKPKKDRNAKTHSANPLRKIVGAPADGSDGDDVVPRKWTPAPGPIPESLLNAEGWYQQDLAILMGYKIELKEQTIPVEVEAETPASEMPYEPTKPEGRKRTKPNPHPKQTAKNVVEELISVPSSPDDDLRQEFLPPPRAARDVRRRASPVLESVVRYAEEMTAWYGDGFEPRSGRGTRSARILSSNSEPAPKPKPRSSKKRKADDARAREERRKEEDMHRRAIEAQEIMEIMQERLAKKQKGSPRREAMEKASRRRHPVTRSLRVPSEVPGSGREEDQHQAKRYRPSKPRPAPAPTPAIKSYCADRQRRGTSESTFLGNA